MISPAEIDAVIAAGVLIEDYPEARAALAASCLDLRRQASDPRRMLAEAGLPGHHHDLYPSPRAMVSRF
jgi:hypothetical protein